VGNIRIAFLGPIVSPVLLADPADFGHLYKRLIPNCYLAFVYDAGHAIGTERPEAFVGLVSDFLDRHDAFVVNRVPTVIHP
jgi:hypothetical protein